MGLLDDVVKFKEYERSQNASVSDAVPAMLQNFIAGQQTKRQSMLDQFKVDAELAKSGMRRDGANNIIRDPNLGGSLDLLKAQDLQSKLNFRNSMLSAFQGMPGATGGPTASGPTGGTGKGFGTFLTGFGMNGPKFGTDSPKDIATRTSGLRDELMKSPYVKNFRDLEKYSTQLNTALDSKDVSQAISDQALVILFNKMLDPASVVREGEYARTGPEALSWENKIKGFVEKMKKGGAGITGKERKSMVKLAKNLLDSSGEFYDSELDRFGDLAESESYRVPRSSVLGGLKYHAPSFETKDEADAADLKDGTIIRIGGKKVQYNKASRNAI